jgi:hypothetical protein
MPDFSNPEHEMFTGRRPRAFQFNCCVGTAILGQALVRCKIELIGAPLWGAALQGGARF